MTNNAEVIIVGAGLCGAVIARELAEQGKKVLIWEKRTHIGGNMYDYVDDYGFLVQKYGPHAFHTTKKELYQYMCRFETWQDYALCCGAEMDKTITPTPFNFKTIEDFYGPEEAQQLKEKIKAVFGERTSATVVELLEHPEPLIRGYAEFLFEKDYGPYTAKQWGISPKEVDPSILKRVPVEFSYEEGYFKDEFQAMPVHSFTRFFENLLDHPQISVECEKDALDHLSLEGNTLLLDGKPCEMPVVYTGALDGLFRHDLGELPYRSLRFQWKHDEKDSLQPYPIVAYPQEEGYTRITEFKKLPPQEGKGTSYAVEYPLMYEKGSQQEPYYPLLTEESQNLYQQYLKRATEISPLVLCGRLADFKYYNMDQALERALEVVELLKGVKHYDTN